MAEGWWVCVVADASFAGGRHDEGTVIEVMKGDSENKPQGKNEAFFKRYFIPGDQRPDVAIKLHKLTTDKAEIRARSEVNAERIETTKGKAELEAARPEEDKIESR